MDNRIIDKTHIVALKEIKGCLRNVEIPIDRPEHFIAELSAMKENPNRTVWDMQSMFIERFPKNQQWIDHIYPQAYYASFVNSTTYPEICTYEQLRTSWDEAAENARKALIEERKQSRKEASTQELAKVMFEVTNRLKRYQKDRFLSTALQWIDAVCYQDAARKASSDQSVKMFSKENIGWNTFRHVINDDVKAEVKTNFGYGSSSHFMLAVSYKGIAILPYSYLVKYYKAGMADLIRCTRKYQPTRESWCAAFDFLSDFVNHAIASPQEFVESYILNEVEEMMRGLEAIATNPRLHLDKIRGRNSDPLIVNVRRMLSDEETRMMSYPAETPILFKVEKITGAIDFLSSLTEIAKEVDSIQVHINRIHELNVALQPEIETSIASINKQIAELEKKRVPIDAELSMLVEKIKPLEEEMSAKGINRWSFHSSNSEYSRLDDKRTEIQSKLSKILSTIADLNSFKSMLETSLSKIRELIQNREAA